MPITDRNAGWKGRVRRKGLREFQRTPWNQAVPTAASRPRAASPRRDAREAARDGGRRGGRMIPFRVRAPRVGAPDPRSPLVMIGNYGPAWLKARQISGCRTRDDPCAHYDYGPTFSPTGVAATSGVTGREGLVVRGPGVGGSEDAVVKVRTGHRW